MNFNMNDINFNSLELLNKRDDYINRRQDKNDSLTSKSNYLINTLEDSLYCIRVHVRYGFFSLMRSSHYEYFL